MNHQEPPASTVNSLMKAHIGITLLVFLFLVSAVALLYIADQTNLLLGFAIVAHLAALTICPRLAAQRRQDVRFTIICTLVFSWMGGITCLLSLPADQAEHRWPT